MRFALVRCTEMLGVVSVSVQLFETAPETPYEQMHRFSYTTTLDAVDGLTDCEFLRDALVQAIENCP